MPRGDANREISILQTADNAAAKKSGAAKYGHASVRHVTKYRAARAKRSYSQLFLKRSRYQPHARRSRRVSSIDEFQACARPSFASGTDGSNPASSSRQSVSAVNPDAIGEKPRTLAAVCGWLGT